MSLRFLTTRLAKHGRQVLQSYWKRYTHSNILEQNQIKRRIPTDVLRSGVFSTAVNNASSVTPRSGIFRFGQHARKLFIDSILNRCTTTYSEELRSRAAKKLFYGDSAPFFALIGVSLASGAGVLTKEDELEGVCWEIREAAGRLQAFWNHDYISETLQDFNIGKLDIGPPIAKGCAAVVYAAALKNKESSHEPSSVPVDTLAATPQTLASYQQSFCSEMMSPIQNMSRFVHNFGGSVDNLNLYHQKSAMSFVELYKEHPREELNNENDSTQAERSSSGYSGVGGVQQELQDLDSTKVSINRYPFALKMMFNYDIQSNALSILRAMYKETVPARQRYMNKNSNEWEALLQDRTLTLPPHPNIVCMFGFFCDEVGNFPDGHLLYPIAQPQRINPHGYGRNMSLYLLMKRYDYSLRKLLDSTKLSTRTKLLLLTQLLEAVTHINRHGVAHRDIKSDNILTETSADDPTPVLVLSDFGCCLADKVHGLQVPFSSFDIDKGGNAALMAPEIINKQPGPFAVLNYAKADLWACGAIAYEIFGLPNPFYSSSGGLAAEKNQNTFSLRNNTYKKNDLPTLGDECPVLVQKLIFNILNPSPNERVSPDIAANIMQLFLWAPSNWLKEGGMPNSPEILQWLLSLTTKVICEGNPSNASVQLQTQKLGFNNAGRRTYVEYLLICSFLSRVRLRRVRGALHWIQNVV